MKDKDENITGKCRMCGTVSVYRADYCKFCHDELIEIAKNEID